VWYTTSGVVWYTTSGVVWYTTTGGNASLQSLYMPKMKLIR